MADNTTTGTGVPVATRSVTYSGDAAQNVQAVALVTVSGSDDSKTATDLALGNAAMAASLPVTIASNQSALPITDNSSSLTVDNAVATAVTGTWDSSTSTTLEIDCTGMATVIFTAVGSAASSANTAVFAGSTDGAAWSALIVSNRATLSTSQDGFSSVLGTSIGSNTFHLVSNVAGLTKARVSFTGALTSGSVAWRLTASAAATWDRKVNVYQITDTNLNARVTSSGTFVVQDNQVIADNAQFTDGTTKLFSAGFIFDETAGTGLTENDAAAARVDAKRALVGVIEDATTRGQRAAVSAGGALSVTGPVAGTVAHDASTANNPVTVGGRAIAHGTNPTAVAAADVTDAYYNRAGVQFTIGGHPNPVMYGMSITTAVTNAIIGPSISAGLKLVVTSIMALLDNASTVFPSVVIGFGTANTPAFATTPGTSKVIAGHPAVAAGGGFTRGDGSGMIGVGADDEELRITTVGTAGGNGLYVLLTGYTIES